MQINTITSAYFNFASELKNWRANTWKTNCLAVLKVISLATVILPLGFLVAHRATLPARITQMPPEPQASAVAEVAQQVLSPPPPAPKPNYKEMVLQGKLNEVLETLKGNDYALGALARELARSHHPDLGFEVAKVMSESHDKISVLGTVRRHLSETDPLVEQVYDCIDDCEIAIRQKDETKKTQASHEMRQLLQQGNLKEVQAQLKHLDQKCEARSLAEQAIGLAIAKGELPDRPPVTAIDFIENVVCNNKEGLLRDVVEVFKQSQLIEEATLHFTAVTSLFPKGTFGNGSVNTDAVHRFAVALAKNHQFGYAHEQFLRIPEKRHDGNKDRLRRDLAKQFTKVNALEMALGYAKEIKNPFIQKEAFTAISWALLKNTHVHNGNIPIISQLDAATQDSLRAEFAKKLAKRGKCADAKLIANNITLAVSKEAVLRYISKKEG